MLSLRDGMGFGQDGRLIRRRRRRRRRRPLEGGRGKWKSQNRIGVLEHQVKSKEKVNNEKIRI